MRLRSDWTYSRMKGEMMHKNVEIRAKRVNAENVRHESKLEDEVGCMDGVRIDERKYRCSVSYFSN